MEKNDGNIKRVVLTGAESTGKTTLAARLAEAYDTVWAPEYLRHFVEQKKALPTPDDVPLIARGHLEAEAALLPQAHRILFLDTDLISSCLYSAHYFGHCPPWLREASHAHHADLYLLTNTDIPWTPDPRQRESREVRDHLQTLFEAELKQRRVPFILVSGPLEQRLQTARTAIDRLLGERST